jgi:hypothetical protein
MKDFLNAVTFKNILDVLTVLISLINVAVVVMVYKLTHRDVNPKLYVKPKIMKDPSMFPKLLNTKIDYNDFNQRGFPEIHHDPYIWSVELHNNGDLPATNISITLSIIIQKAIFHEQKYAGDIEKHRLVDFKEYNHVFMFDYIPPNSSVNKDFLLLSGEFPSAILKVKKLVSSERTFINKPTQIGYYKHLLFGNLADMDDYRKLLGVYKGTSNHE